MFCLNAARMILGIVAMAASKVAPLNGRFGVRERMLGPFPEGPCLWMHGASLGECKMLLSLANILKREPFELPPILITTQKVEVVEYLRTSPDAKNLRCALAPLDTPQGLSRFMREAKPVMLVLAENELWPGFLSSMKVRFAMPSVALVSGRFYRCASSESFDSLGFVSMQTSADLARFMAFGEYLISAKAIVGGDWKLLSWALSEEKNFESEKTVDTAFLSFHREELKPLLKMLRSAVSAGETAVLAPRFEEELSRFETALSNAEIACVRWPDVRPGAVSLVCEYGKISGVLKASRSAVIGGSFAQTLGVHDFWESLRTGVLTYIGPYSRGQREAVRLLLAENAIVRLKNPLEYSTRKIPDLAAAVCFLGREREKILASYRAFARFVETVVRRNSDVEPLPSKTLESPS